MVSQPAASASLEGSRIYGLYARETKVELAEYCKLEVGPSQKDTVRLTR